MPMGVARTDVQRRSCVLTLTFLGVGSAFAKRNLQSNVLLEAWSRGPGEQHSPDACTLVDFGCTGPLAMHRLKDRKGFEYLDCGGLINYPAIQSVVVTHLHADHVGGLEELALMTRYNFPNAADTEHRRTELVGSREVLSSLWEHTLKGGLGPLRGRPAQLADYFTIRTVCGRGEGTPDRVRILDRYELIFFRTQHVQMINKYDWPSYGLLLADDRTGDTVLYSGDTRFDPDSLGDMMARARLIFHDVQLEETEDPLHPPLSALHTLPEPVRRKMVLYHYGDDWDNPQYDFVSKDFAGFAQPMRRYTLFEDR